MGGAADRRMRIAFGIWASALFAVLWAGIAISAVGGAGLAADAWRALNGLHPLVEVAVWLLCLPIPVALWAAQPGQPTILVAFVVVGLVAWTAVAWFGLARTLLARGRT
jgi:hypothetical protein